MTTPVLSRRDLDFLLHEWLDVESLTGRERYAEHYRDTFDAVLDLAQTVATGSSRRTTAQRRRGADLRRRAGAPAPGGGRGARRLHPQRLPGRHLRRRARRDAAAARGRGRDGRWFEAANCVTGGVPVPHPPTPTCWACTGRPSRSSATCRPMLEGRFFGTMCLTEPQAGSSLADVQTRAEPQDDGTVPLIRATRCGSRAATTTSAENIVHLVLARIEGAPAGVKGISLFAGAQAPRRGRRLAGRRNDVVLAGLNHKMGWRGTANLALNFGEGAHLPAAAPARSAPRRRAASRLSPTCST